MRIKYLFLISSCLLLFPNIRAQNQILFNHLKVEDGLSQSSVTCILQDKKGFMWFGTQDGLNRYDGYNIVVFKNNPSDSTSLSNNFIYSLIEDSSGILYVGTQGGVYQRYNPLTESFTRLPKDSINFEGAKYNFVTPFYADSSGVQWTGGMSAAVGLKKTDPKTGKVKIYRHDPSDPASLSDDKVFSVFRDRAGHLWVGTANGLDELNENTGKFTHYRNNPNNPNSLSGNWTWPIYEDSEGYLWIGTFRGGLNKFDPRSKTFINFKNDPFNPRSLSSNSILSIYKDRSGIIWIGTNEGGLNYFLPSAQVFNVYTSKPGNKNGLSENFVISMLADKNGNYWIGTRGGGLNKFDYEKNTFKTYLHNPTSSNSISSNAVVSLYQDRSGILWIGNINSGLDEFNPENNTFKHYKNNPSDPNSLSDNRIYSIVQDKEGNIWIGTYAGGLNKLDPKTGKITRFKHQDNNPESISSDAVRSIAIDNSGILWLGTYGGGVDIFDPVKNTATNIKSNPNDPKSLLDNNILRVFIDSKNNVWIGSIKGLSRYNRQNNTFKNYREQDGLPNESIFGILEDKSGDLWIGTNKGLSRFNPKTEKFKNFYADDGLQGDEFNQNAFAKDNLTGRLLFGGPNGFNVFNPDKIKDNYYKPPIVFTGYARYNTDNLNGKPILEKGISDRDSLYLTYKDNIIILQFAALSYYNNSENHYRYKLKGFNNNWIQLGNKHSVTFTNLSPGNYNLSVIGSNNDGLWNQKGASLFIEVTPPWWKTNIAYIIYFLAFIGVLLEIRRFENKRREQKAKMRENELRLKATEAEKRAIEIENERKTKELEEARQLQLSMLPKELPKLPNLEIAAFMKTATEVGGDYYDFIVQEDGVLNVAFGDATGHGLQAGTMVTLMKGFFTSDATKLELKDFMSHCTAMIKEIKLGRILMSFSLLRIFDSKLSITSAGMPPLYYYNKKSEEVHEIKIQGMPLGAMRKFSYKVVEKEIKSGDILLLLTDGLPEQMNESEEMYGYHRVKERFKNAVHNTPDNIIKNLVKSGEEWKGEIFQQDDISFVVIKVK